MDLHQLLKPYKRKIILEAAVRGIALGLLVGLVTVLGSALLLGGGGLGIKAILAFFSFREIPVWVDILLGAANIAASLTIGLIAGGISGALMFVSVYKKGTNEIAKQVDSLGLEERVVTMVEYQNDPSYVAYVQRQDAQTRLAEFNLDSVKVKFPAEKLMSAVALVLSVLVVFATIPFVSNAIDLEREKIEEELNGEDEKSKEQIFENI